MSFFYNFGKLYDFSKLFRFSFLMEDESYRGYILEVRYLFMGHEYARYLDIHQSKEIFTLLLSGDYFTHPDFKFYYFRFHKP